MCSPLSRKGFFIAQDLNFLFERCFLNFKIEKTLYSMKIK